MKILVINTKYRVFGGEDSNIDDEIDFFKKNNEVFYLEYKNSDRVSFFEILSFFINSNLKSNLKLKQTIKKFNPDLIYVHNTWFKAHLGVFNVLKKSNKRVILKLHNFRYDCTNNFLLKNHLAGYQYCNKCGLKNSKFKFFNKYFPESTLKSLFIIRYGKKYFKLISNNDFELIVLTNFHKNYLIKLGVKPKNINVLPNLIIKPQEKNEYQSNSNYLVYAGRVEANKGVAELIDAWLKSETTLQLKIIGQGEQLEQLLKFNDNKHIEILGPLDHFSTLELIKKSRGVVTATKMYEGQPRILSEASLFGVPSIFPDFGGMSEFFPKNYPLAFEQFNYPDLIKKIKWFNNMEFLQNLSKQIMENFENQFNETNYQHNFQKFFLNEIKST